MHLIWTVVYEILRSLIFGTGTIMNFIHCSDINYFQENLKHEDSFIYLSSINGLAVMANVFPNTVIKTLVEEYAEMRTKKTVADNNNNSAELKMKVGEVLVRVTKLLGK